MDPGFRTPLLDFFRREEVARDVRLLAARGALAPRAHEQLALLMHLTNDYDPEVARAAEATLAAIPVESLSAFLARADVPDAMRAFFAARDIHPAAAPAAGAEQPIVEAEAGADDAPSDETSQATVLRVAALSIVERVMLAMRGSREERAILIRDPSKLVALSVLSSPKLSDSEVESFARMPGISDEILRTIANTRAWVKSYPVVVALTRNPKTPPAVAMNLLSRLNDRDLRVLSTDRNVADVVRVTARKKLVIGA
jgi:hypothetical protein